MTKEFAESQPWLFVIGLGMEGIDALPPFAREIIETAEVIFGGTRHLNLRKLPDASKRISWQTPLLKTMEEIAHYRGKKTVVLASGDPQWYGVGVTLSRHFSPAEMLIIPSISAFSLAAARLGWAVAASRCVTIHGRSIHSLNRYWQGGARILILAENRDSPLQVARLLCARGFGDSLLHILSNLTVAGDGEGESLMSVTARDAEAQLQSGIAQSGIAISDLNTIAVDCAADRENTTGNLSRTSLAAGRQDRDYQCLDGQLTKQPIRAVVLAMLAPRAGDILWDIGGGSGSVAIEFLRLLLGSKGGGWSDQRPRAIVFEKNQERCQIIRTNAETMGVPELELVEGVAPICLAATPALPAPTVVFIGGGLGDAALFETVWQRLAGGGRLVAVAVTLASESRLLALQTLHGGELMRLSVDRSEPMGAREPRTQVWRPLLPVTLWSVVK